MWPFSKQKPRAGLPERGDENRSALAEGALVVLLGERGDPDRTVAGLCLFGVGCADFL